MNQVVESHYRRMSSEQAANLVIDSELALLGMEDLPPQFADTIFSTLQRAIDRRSKAGFIIDPESREEVNGMVNSHIADFDPLPKARGVLTRFVVGITQTDAATLRRFRDLRASEGEK